MSGTRIVALVAGAILLALPSAAMAHGAPIPGNSPVLAAAAVARRGGPGKAAAPKLSGACRASLAVFAITPSNGRQGVVGFYLGGKNTKCALKTLHPKTASKWVSEQASKRRSLAPLWVGRQAPCAKGYSYSIDAKSRNNARRQGEDAADAAVYEASRLGLAKGSILYYDMGNYDQGKSACQGAVAAFLSGWDYEIHARGHKAGVYTAPAQAKADRESLRILAPELEPDNILVGR